MSKTTDASGTEVKVRVYDSFGNVVYTSGSLLGDRVSFTGRELEEDLGLYYYRARFYDPNIGRFISRDPIGLAAGDQNFYRYVGNNSVNLIDPMGLGSKKPYWERVKENFLTTVNAPLDYLPALPLNVARTVTSIFISMKVSSA